MEKVLIWAAVIILVIWVIKKRNAFESLRQDIKKAGSEISNYMKKREDSLNDALSIAKLSYGKEVEGIERLTASDKLEQLSFLGEKYPVLQTMGSYSSAVNEAFQLNHDITASRTTLNSNINEYNKVIKAFPGLIVALIFGYKEEKLIDQENLAAHRHLDMKGVDFSNY